VAFDRKSPRSSSDVESCWIDRKAQPEMAVPQETPGGPGEPGPYKGEKRGRRKADSTRRGRVWVECGDYGYYTDGVADKVWD
jgi:hypothetical protein